MKAPTNPKKSGEFEIIARYFAPLAAGVPGAFGLKDDAAFLEIPEGHELVAKTDAAVARGLARDQAEFGVHLVGGDTKSTPGPATFAITLLGLVRASWGLHRSGAHPGDELYVTGTIGDGALGLLARKGELGGLKPKAREQLIDRYRLPRPRAAAGPPRPA